MGCMKDGHERSTRGEYYWYMGLVWTCYRVVYVRYLLRIDIDRI